MTHDTVQPVPDDIAGLAHAFGIATEYRDQQGQHRLVPLSTVIAVLAAMGVDAETDGGRAAGWDRITNGPWRRMLPPTTVTVQGVATSVLVHVPDGHAVEAWVEFETGGRAPLAQLEHLVPARMIDGLMLGEAAFQLDHNLPLGWHEIHVRSEGGQGAAVLKQQGVLVVTPAYLGLPASMQGHQQWGLMAQLYATRSHDSWGIGDLHDLGSIAAWAGARGGSFVLVNPLHAAEPSVPVEPSPYLPTTRRYFNPIYIRIEDIPEYQQLAALKKMTIVMAATIAVLPNHTADLIDRDPIWEMKATALATVFSAPLSPERQEAFTAYCAREGAGLTTFARWCAFAEQYGTASQLWPAGLQHPQGPDVEAEAERLADRVAFHKRCQWILDEQLASAQARARDAGMAAGIVHDLAVGVHPDGADSWALQDVLAKTMNVGAPPDMYNQQGQDWSQPPWRPDALAESGYAAYRDMLRTILRHAGGIRVDHALGLFRLWWIPVGAEPHAGTYVTFDHQAMVGILALEAQRAGAFVVGEDLGTVESWVRDYLQQRGILSTSILWFEHNGWGQPLEPEHWRELCFASVTVHDLPPTAGMLRGEHIRLRHDLGLLSRQVADEWDDWHRERGNWVRVLRERGLITGEGEPADDEIMEGLHKYLALTPARLLAIGLPDLVGDVRAQNQPGTNREYPNWCIPTCDGEGIPVTIEDLAERADLVQRADRLIAALAHRAQ
ncbi:MAG: 4-alpha-glucanotransferase [Candidatus Nanopelagicales bacterium]